MVKTYNTWNHHREQLDNVSSSNTTRVDNAEPIVDPNEQVMDIINYVFPFASTNTNQEREDKEFDGKTEYRLRPREWSSDQILEQFNHLDFALFRKLVSRTRPSTHMN
ncbi:hypothetical protein PS2_019462 [Malus domestica]